MIQTICSEIFESDIYLSLVNFELREEILLLTFDLEYEDNHKIIQKWQVACEEFKEHRLEVNYFYSDDFKVLNEHPYLWDCTKDFSSLYFQGTVEDINKVIGDLYIKHSEVTKGLIPFDTYINSEGIGWILNANFGLFAEAPEDLIHEYAKVLNGYGLKTSVIPSKRKRKDKKYKVFLFGDSYVVAKKFEAVRLV